MELKTETGMSLEIFEAARASGLSVCTAARSTFNGQVDRFAAAITAPLQAEIDRLRIELAELRQFRDGGTVPPAPAGCIEYSYCAGTSTGARHSTTLVCHLEYSEALPETETDAAEPARVRLIAAYHCGVDVLDTLVSKSVEMEIEEQALAEVQS